MSFFEQILVELRMPDFHYQFEHPSAVYDKAFHGFLLQYICSWPREGLVANFKQTHSRQDLPVVMYNSLYVADRIVDAFLRKNLFDETIGRAISRLRAGMAFLLAEHEGASFGLESSLLKHMALLQEAWAVWSPEPKRFADLMLHQLAQLCVLPAQGSAYRYELNASLTLIAATLRTQQENREKVLERLGQSEQGAALARGSLIAACEMVNNYATGRLLPPPVSDFLVGPWLNVLRNAYLQREREPVPWEQVRKLTKTMIWAFGDTPNRKQDRLFTVGETLVDELSAYFDDLSEVGVFFESFNQLLVAEIQEQKVDKNPFEPIHCEFEQVKSEKASSTLVASCCSRWYLQAAPGAPGRVMVARYLEPTNEFLLVNQAGMKSAIVPGGQLERWLRDGVLKPLPPVYSILDVVSDIERGLSKVALAQIDARRKAREKAALEVQRLRLAQELAQKAAEAQQRARQQAMEEEALLIAQEAARTAEAEETRRAEAARHRHHEMELAARARVDSLKLGAWLEFREPAPLRMKLAVRMLATQKFIFVDRVGLQRHEISCHELIERLVADRVRILSEGEDFSDALVKVVGKIRDEY